MITVLLVSIALQAKVDRVAPLFSRDLQVATCRQYALAADYLMDMGEAKALKHLDHWVRTGGFGAHLRAAELCRILYVPKPGKEIGLEGWGDVVGSERAPSKDWPEFPMFQQNGVWFTLSQGILRGGGSALEFSKYAAYCKAAGNFRTGPVQIPRREQAKPA